MKPFLAIVFSWCVISAGFAADLPITNNAAIVVLDSSYRTLNSWGPYANSGKYGYWNQNNIHIGEANRGGGSTQEANEGRLERRGLALLANGSQYWILINADNNGGYTTTNLLYAQLTNTFNAPGLLFNGTSYVNEGGWAAAHAGQIKVITGGDIPQPGHTLGSDAEVRNNGMTNAPAIFGNYMGVDVFHPIYSQYGRSNDIATGANHWQDSLDSVAAPLDGEHPGPPGALLMAINENLSEMSSNLDSCLIDAGAVSIVSTQNCVIGSLTNSGIVISFTRKTARIAMGWDFPDGTITNDAWTGASIMWPGISNAFNQTITLTNLPNGTYAISEDGSNILTKATVNGVLSFNMFPIMKGADWAQRKEIVGRCRDKLNCDRVTLRNGSAGNGLGGEVGYDSYSQLYWNSGNRGDTLIANLAPQLTNLNNFDALIWAAATPTNHTFSITFQGTIVDGSANISLPTDAAYHSALGRAPGDGSVQTLNPPVFTWLYYNVLTNFLSGSQGEVRYFCLQLTTNGSFSSPLWNITNAINFYNFLAPITNSDGSTWTGSNSWRVIYYDRSTNNIGTSSVQTFTMPSSARLWDRSKFADTNYLVQISTNHPHLMFWGTNRTSLASYFGTNNNPEYPGQHITDITNAAITVIQNGSWNSSTYWNDVGGTNTSGTFGFLHFGSSLAKVGFSYQLTTNADIIAADPGKMMEIYATNLILYGYDHLDGYQASDLPSSFPLAYDWLYPLMTASERTNALRFMENEAQSFVDESWLYTAVANTNGVFTNTLYAGNGSSFRAGNSHTRNGQIGLCLCLAGMGESKILRDLFPYYLNYYIAQFDPFQGDDGRAYNSVQNFQLARQGSAMMLAAISLPQLQLSNAPIYTTLLKQFAYDEPLGYGLDAELEPFCWGVQGGAPATFKPQWIYTRFYNVALWLQSGPAMRQYQRAKSFNGGSGVGENLLFEVFTPFYFPAVTQSDWPDNYYLDPIRGWAISSSLPPSNYGAYTNGVGFIFQARPSGAGIMNAAMTDGQVEIWAYGAHVTTGGSGNYEEHPMFQNNGLFVDGIGVYNQTPPISNPVLAKFTAFTNGPNFTVAQADLTWAFPHTNYDSSGYQNVARSFYKQATNARPYISSVTRTVAFLDKTNATPYFIIYDSFQTTQPAKFESKWNVWSTNGFTVNSGAGTFSYLCTNSYNGSNVTVYVSDVVDPTTMTLTNMNSGGNLFGTNVNNLAKMNPYTGENYNLATNDVYYPDHFWPYWASSIWLENKNATTNWHFMRVVIPMRWDITNAPTVTRLDDNTVVVALNDGSGIVDTNTFSTNYSGPSTYLVNLAGLGSTNAVVIVNNPGIVRMQVTTIRSGTVRVGP